MGKGATTKEALIRGLIAGTTMVVVGAVTMIVIDVVRQRTTPYPVESFVESTGVFGAILLAVTLFVVAATVAFARALMGLGDSSD